MSMFQRLMSCLTALAFIAHGLWGCCWHDAHEGSLRNTSVSAPSQHVDCCKHHHGSDEKREPSDGPCKLHCRNVCVYVSPLKCQLDCLQIELRLDSAVIAVLQTNDGHLAAAEVRSGTDGPREAKPPARIHLLHQIFLI